MTEPAHLWLLFKRVRSHLAPGGEFIFDLFVPDRNVDALPDSHVFRDYCRTLADGTLLKRTKTIQKNIRPNINLIERKYRFIDSSERIIKTITTTDLIRYYHPREIKELLLSNGFQISAMLADFEEGELSESTGSVCIRCRPGALSRW